MAPSGFDLDLLAWLNRPGIHWLDVLMLALSSRMLLLPLAAVAALWVWARSPFGPRAALLLVLAIGAADLLAVRAVKPLVHRVRPCRTDPRHVAAPAGCGPGASFPSAHATDLAAAATVVSWAVPALSPFAIALALAVGASRVYLGVHWPSDVFGGWILGALVAWLFIGLGRARVQVR